MRVAIGIAVFSGMLGVTFFGLFLTPVFFTTIEGLLERRRMTHLMQSPAAEDASAATDEPRRA
jgi:hypothetical protein